MSPAKRNRTVPLSLYSAPKIFRQWLLWAVGKIILKVPLGHSPESNGNFWRCLFRTAQITCKQGGIWMSIIVSSPIDSILNSLYSQIAAYSQCLIKQYFEFWPWELTRMLLLRCSLQSSNTNLQFPHRSAPVRKIAVPLPDRNSKPVQTFDLLVAPFQNHQSSIRLF